MRRCLMGVLALLQWSTTAYADAIDDCNGTVKGAARRIEACTLLINEGKLSSHNMSRAFNNRANAFSDKEEYDAAISDYTRSIEFDSGYANNYSGRAFAHDKKGDYDATIADYTKIMEIEPKSAWPYDERGDEYKKKGDYDAAIADYTRALEIDPRIRIESSRADAYLKKGDIDKAIADYTIAIQRDARDWIAYNGRAYTYLKAGNAAQGLADAEQALELQPNDPDELATRGAIFEALGRREDAMADFQRALAKDENNKESKAGLARLGALPQPLDEIEALHEHLVKLDNDKKTEEAIAVAKEYARAIEIREGTDTIDYAFAIGILVDLYVAEARFDEAEPLARQALEIRERLPVSDQMDVSRSLTAVAGVLLGQSKLADAEGFLRQALEIRQRVLRPDHPRVAQSLNNVAVVLFREGQYAQSETFLRLAISILEKDQNALGAPGDLLLTALSSLAGILEAQQRQGEAEAIYRRGLTVAQTIVKRKVKESAEGAPSPSRESSMLGKGTLFLQCGQNWSIVLAHVRRITDKESMGDDRERDASYDPYNDNPLVKTRVRAAYRMGPGQAEFEEEGFAMAQRLLLNQAARAVSQLGARFGSGTGALAGLIREQQDRLGRRKSIDKLLKDNYSGGQVSRIEESEESLRTSLANEEDKALDAIEARLKTEFPDYAALARPEPLNIADVQGQLGANEALVLFLDMDKWASVTGEETFIWAITKTESRWVRSELGTESLTEKVATLRCGLDAANWIDANQWSAVTDDGKRRKEAQIARRERCEQLTDTKIADAASPPFDLVKSHELYQALFGEIADLVKDKQLLIVPSGPLTSLPFQVLVTDTPEFAIPRNAADYATAQWLIRQSSLTVLPSVSSLKALRRDAKPSQATIPFIGFGNPLLLGPKENDNRAFAKQTCPESPATAEPVRIATVGTTDSRASFFRGGLGDVAILRRQAPLPETADELCTIANEVGAPKADIHLGASATETVVKSLNADGTLNKARVVHFATHGLIADETEQVANSVAEPALLLTPPATPTEQDDGLLTASEVAQLKLDADWVVLSACNTAAGSGAGNAEALSGLARAFFYAGARALLVSHWYVDSRTAVLLTTRAFAELEQDPNIGRGEALRRAMLAAMYDTGRPKSWIPAAHPALWAPFVVVGEGGAAARARTFNAAAPASVAAPIAATDASTDAAKVEQKQPKSKKTVARRRKPSGDWDWLGGF